MASTDARPVPRKSVAFRVTFPILDADGDLVTGAAGLDSEISKDGGTFADCTNEATEIATSSGMYYLDLTSTEMGADTVAIIVKTSTAGAKTTPMVIYPEEAGDFRADVTHWLGTAAATPTVAGVPEVDVTHWIGTAAAAPTVAGVPKVDISNWNGVAITSALARFDAALTIGTSDSGTTTTMVDAALTSAVTNFYAGMEIWFCSGTLDGWGGKITAFDPATDTITFTPAAPASVTTQNYIIMPAGRVDVGLWLGSVPTATPDTIKADTAAIVADTNELQTDWVDGGRLDLILDARASQTSVDDVPTNTELATALGTADDAVLTQVALVKAKTDSLTFTVAGQVDANIQYVNDVAVTGDGQTGTEWGPA